MSTRGFFLTFEGGEGVGKTTNLGYLENILQDQGIDLIVTREPGGSELGEKIRELLLDTRSDNINAMTELLLLFAARAQHISERIEPALAAGQWVLCDRFTDATYAYQSGGRGVSMDTVKRLEELVQVGLRPNYTILLDVPVETGMARARGRGELDRIERETMDFFERVRASYLEQASCNFDRYRIVDASVSIEEVRQQILGIAGEVLSHWKTQRSGG